MNQFTPWTLKENNWLKAKFKGEFMSWPQLSTLMKEELNVDRTPTSIRKKAKRLKLDWSTVTETKEEHESELQKFLAKAKEIKSWYSDPETHRTRGVMDPEKSTRKILSLSDIHFPFAANDLIAEAIEDHQDADVVVLNGDIVDGYAASRWPKFKRVIAIHEYMCAFELVKYLANRFPNVVLVVGNHDDPRLQKHLAGNGTAMEVMDILRPNIMHRIANGEEIDESGRVVKVHDFSNVHINKHNDWFFLVGKTMFIHPHTRGSSHPGFSVKKWANSVPNFLNDSDWDSMVMGHTHQVFKGIVKQKLLIEQGCMAGFQDYTMSPKSGYAQPPVNGYAVIYQDKEGNTDYNKSSFIFKGHMTCRNVQDTFLL